MKKTFITFLILCVYSNFSFLLAQNDKNNKFVPDVKLSDTMSKINSILGLYIDTENEAACNIIEGRFKHYFGEQKKSVQDSIVGRLYKDVKRHIANDDIDATKKYHIFCILSLHIMTNDFVLSSLKKLIWRSQKWILFI